MLMFTPHKVYPKCILKNSYRVPLCDSKKILRNPKADSQIKIIFKAPGVLIYQYSEHVVVEKKNAAKK